MSIESVVSSNYLILCHTLLLLPSIFPSIRVFANESALCIRWPKYYSFSINLPSKYSGLISFGIAWFDLLRIDWFDLLRVQGTLKSILQQHSSKASIRKLPQDSYPYISISTSILFSMLSLGIYKGHYSTAH